MNRIQKYKESLIRFIKDKSCLMDNSNDNLNNFIFNKIKDDDLIFPILLLTIMNNQNKKNHVTMQGYYLATAIEFLVILLKVIEQRKDITVEIGPDKFTVLCNRLIINASKSFEQNLESIKNVYQQGTFINIVLESLSSFNECVRTVNDFHDFNFDMTTKSCHQNVMSWYIKDNVELREKFITFKQVTKKSINDYIARKYTTLCELAIVIGWVIGGGTIKESAKLKKSAKCFAHMYKMSHDFDSINNDIKSGKYMSNYVVNFGLQDGYEIFLNNKQAFIEESMVEDIYTNTVKEIIDEIEENIDMIIDQTSPDLKSSYSSKK